MLFPPEFSAPPTSTVERFSLRLLAPPDVHADLQAVHDSAARIRGVFGPDNQWPPDELTFEENLADLARHLDESLSNQSFAYSIWRDEQYAACLYIKPFKSKLTIDHRRGIYRELCYLWVNTPFMAEEAAIYAACRRWVPTTFPLTGAVWPGRELSWEQWHALALA